MHSACYLIYLHLLELLNITGSCYFTSHLDRAAMHAGELHVEYAIILQIVSSFVSLAAAMHAGELHVEYAIILQIVSSFVASVPYVRTTSNFQCKCTSYCTFVLPSSKLNGCAENISASVLSGGVC